ncbi:MAG: hypothetical protein ABIE07_14070 [Candidatus Zixiibacteriota bacterium]
MNISTLSGFPTRFAPDGASLSGMTVEMHFSVGVARARPGTICKKPNAGLSRQAPTGEYSYFIIIMEMISEIAVGLWGNCWWDKRW